MSAPLADPFFGGSVVFRRFFATGWAIFALVMAAQRYVLAPIDGVEMGVAKALSIGFGFSTLISLLGLAGLAVARAFPFRTDRWLSALLLSAGVGMAVAAAYSHLEVVTRAWLGDPGAVPASLFPVAWAMLLPGRAILLFNMVAVGNALRFFREAAEREGAAARLEAQIAESRLDLMKLRVQPRLLFGMLDVLAGLVRTDVAAADRALARLSDFLRATLYRDSETDATLEAESELLRLYLGVVSGGGGRPAALRVDLEPEAADAAVPHLLLEAVADVLLPPRGAAGAGGRLSLRARVAGGRLLVQARGPSPPNAAAPDAVAALAERLASQYGDRHRIELRPAPGGGALLTMDLPLRIATDAEMDEAANGGARERVWAR
ncbi:MAG TPA: histidine kinase [Longimicrobium sp.]|nr:histidine kinase [Longimicrobium sp.]